eukprot:m.242977 g.242977  ORF g.242977 m.242977 type:complete len:557 (+) comp14138_c0_seq1:237-1907(+)
MDATAIGAVMQAQLNRLDVVRRASLVCAGLVRARTLLQLAPRGDRVHRDARSLDLRRQGSDVLGKLGADLVLVRHRGQVLARAGLAHALQAAEALLLLAHGREDLTHNGRVLFCDARYNGRLERGGVCPEDACVGRDEVVQRLQNRIDVLRWCCGKLFVGPAEEARHVLRGLEACGALARDGRNGGTAQAVGGGGEAPDSIVIGRFHCRERAHVTEHRPDRLIKHRRERRDQQYGVMVRRAHGCGRHRRDGAQPGRVPRQNLQRQLPEPVMERCHNDVSGPRPAQRRQHGRRMSEGIWACYGHGIGTEGMGPGCGIGAEGLAQHALDGAGNLLEAQLEVDGQTPPLAQRNGRGARAQAADGCERQALLLEVRDELLRHAEILVELVRHTRREHRRESGENGLDHLRPDRVDHKVAAAARERRGACYQGLILPHPSEQARIESIQALAGWTNAILCDTLSQHRLDDKLAEESHRVVQLVDDSKRAQTLTDGVRAASPNAVGKALGQALLQHATHRLDARLDVGGIRQPPALVHCKLQLVELARKADKLGRVIRVSLA